ncbi:MAG: hypothetical protein BWY54_00586 [Candidatus Dependentiae bacterium ADurb.Bin331]|nr:MAG: hypothetical protein BWY54_00586 [Candidatus Dependentiae bacterium ADurb.Bin331]
MSPMIVLSPVAYTMPIAFPVINKVPAKAQLTAVVGSWAGFFSSCAVLLTGIDSPVNTDSSNCAFSALINRISAGTLSPGIKMTRSPGTISSLEMVICFPLRIMVSYCTRYFFSD